MFGIPLGILLTNPFELRVLVRDSGGVKQHDLGAYEMIFVKIFFLCKAKCVNIISAQKKT